MAKLKGYNYSKISTNKIKKNKYILSPEIEKQMNRDNLNAQMQTALANSGLVYFISRKKEICGVVIVKYTNYQVSDFELEKDTTKASKPPKTIAKNTKQDAKALSTYAYELDSLYLTSDLKEKEQFIMSDCMELLKEAAIFGSLGVKLIIWGDNVIADKTIEQSSSSALSIGICFGVAIGAAFGLLLFDNIALGMCLGISVGMALSATYYAGARKKSFAENESE